MYGPSTKTLAKRIKRVEKGIELKYIDAYTESFGNTGVDNTTPRDYLLNASVNNAGEGDGNERIGDEIRMTSCHVKLQVHLPTGDASPPQEYRMRVVLFWDMQPNGEMPVFAGGDATQALFDTSVISDQLISPRMYQNIGRYKILFDKKYVFYPTAVGAQDLATGATERYAYNVKDININRKFSRIIKYNSLNTGSITDINRNALWLYLVSNAPPDQTDPDHTRAIHVDFSSRCYFKDA